MAGGMVVVAAINLRPRCQARAMKSRDDATPRRIMTAAEVAEITSAKNYSERHSSFLVVCSNLFYLAVFVGNGCSDLISRDGMVSAASRSTRYDGFHLP
jgi:hypothetical protein